MNNDQFAETLKNASLSVAEHNRMLLAFGEPTQDQINDILFDMIWPAANTLAHVMAYSIIMRLGGGVPLMEDADSQAMIKSEVDHTSEWLHKALVTALEKHAEIALKDGGEVQVINTVSGKKVKPDA